jgi:hypothetical protein
LHEYLFALSEAERSSRTGPSQRSAQTDMRDGRTLPFPGRTGMALHILITVEEDWSLERDIDIVLVNHRASRAYPCPRIAMSGYGQAVLATSTSSTFHELTVKTPPVPML